MRRGCPVLIAGVVIVAGGCPRQERPLPPPVVVVDLKRVAAGSGHDERVKALHDTKTAELRAELEKLKAALMTEYNHAVSAAGTAPSPKKQQELDELRRKLQVKLDEESARATRVIENLHEEAARFLRADTQAVTRKLVVANGNSVVLVNGEYLLDHDPSVDLTDAVVAELKRIREQSRTTPPEPRPSP